MIKTRTITIPIKQKTAEVFVSILDLPQKIFSDAKKDDNDWWNFSTEKGTAKVKFNINQAQYELNPTMIENTVKWDIPMKVVTSGEFSEIIVTLSQPKKLTEREFEEKVKEAEGYLDKMKQIIENN